MAKSPMGGMCRLLMRCLIVAALVCVVLPAQSARALSETIYGVDSWFDSPLAPQEQNVNDIELFAVDGAPDDILYLDVYKDGELVAERVALRLGDFTKDEGETVSSVISVDITPFDPASTYHVQAFAYDMAVEGEPLLYDGVIQPIYGVFGEDDTTGSLIATRMVRDNENRVFVAHRTYAKDGQTWQLTSENPVADPQGAGRVVYRYERIPEDALSSMAAHVYFVNIADEAKLIHASNVTVAPGKTIPVKLDDTVKLGEASYRVYAAQAQDYLGGEGLVDLTVPCVPVMNSEGAGASTASASTSHALSASELSKNSHQRQQNGTDAASSGATQGDAAQTSPQASSDMGSVQDDASLPQGTQEVEIVTEEAAVADSHGAGDGDVASLSLADFAATASAPVASVPAAPSQNAPTAEAAPQANPSGETINDEENPLAGPSATLRSDTAGSSIELHGSVLLGMVSFLTVLMLFLVLYRDGDEDA